MSTGSHISRHLGRQNDGMDKLSELKKRIDQYLEHTLAAEKTALEKLQTYPKPKEELTPVDILKREMLRHHTRSLILNEVKEWIDDLL